MKQLKSLILTLPVVTLMILGLGTVVYAESGSGGPCVPPKECPFAGNETSDTTTNTSSGGQSTVETETTNKTEAQNLLKQLRMAHKEHTAAERQKNCRAAKNGLEHKLTNLDKNAGAFKTRIDNIFTKAQTYQSTNNVVVANWDQLIAAAQAAQSKAAASVAALQTLSPSLDCTSSTVADNIATFRTAAKQARTDLISYKQAVKDVLKALEATKDTTSSATGGTQ